MKMEIYSETKQNETFQKENSFLYIQYYFTIDLVFWFNTKFATIFHTYTSISLLDFELVTWWQLTVDRNFDNTNEGLWYWMDRRDR